MQGYVHTIQARLHAALAVSMLTVYLGPAGAASDTSSVNAASSQKYVWQQFEMEIPSSWKMESEADDNGARILRLAATTAKPRLVLVLTIAPNMPQQDPKYLQVPGLAGVALSYPVVAQAAGNKDDAMLTLSEVQLGIGPAAAAQLIIPSKDRKNFVSAHSFSKMKDGLLLAGFLLTFGQPGGINEDPTYHRAIAEAYAMLRTIQISK